VDASELVTQAAELPAKARKTPARGKVLDDTQLADVFGIEMDGHEALPETKKKATGRRTKPTETPVVEKKATPKTPAKKAVAAATKKTTDPKPRKAKKQLAAEASATRESANSVTGKRASRQAASDAPAQAKRKKAQT
jgi:hypothetical protein